MDASLFLSYIIWETKSGNTSWNVVLMTSPSQEQPCHPMKDAPCHVKTELGVKVQPSSSLLELCVKSVGKRQHCFAQTVVAHIVSHAAISAIRIQEGKATVWNLSLRLIPKLWTPLKPPCLRVRGSPNKVCIIILISICKEVGFLHIM